MRNIAALGVLSVLGLLAGCGQKGPLMLPDAQKHKPVLTNPALPQTGAHPAATPPPAATPAPAPAATPTPSPTPTPAPPAAAPDASSQTKDDKSLNAASTP
jgi:predicted small lipoprotein YifL